MKLYEILLNTISVAIVLLVISYFISANLANHRCEQRSAIELPVCQQKVSIQSLSKNKEKL